MNKVTKLIVTITFLLLSNLLAAQSTFHSRIHQNGGNIKVEKLIQTLDGGYITIGGISGINLNDSADVLVIKYNLLGQIDWSKIYGDSLFDYGTDIIQTQDGGFFLTGYTELSASNSDILAVKLNYEGEVIWSKLIGANNNDEGVKVLESIDNNYYILSKVDINVFNSRNVGLIKMNPIGDILNFVKYNFSGSSIIEPSGIIEGQQQTIYFICSSLNPSLSYVNSFLCRINSSGNVIKTNRYTDGIDGFNFYSIIHGTNNDFFIGGRGYVGSGSGGNDGFLLRIDALGDTIFSKRYSFTSKLQSICLSSENAIYGVGDGVGVNKDVTLLKTNLNGSPIWSKWHHGFYDDYGKSVIQSNDGNLVFASEGKTTTSLLSKNILAKCDTSGYSGCSYSNSVTGVQNANIQNYLDSISDNPFIFSESIYGNVNTINYLIDSVYCQNIDTINKFPFIKTSNCCVYNQNTLLVSGGLFSNSSNVHIIITGPGDFNYIDSTTSTNWGTFNYQLLIDSTFSIGNYLISGFDVLTGISSASVSVSVSNVNNTLTKLNITSPSQDQILKIDEAFNISWKDRLVNLPNYSIIGSQRNYSYNIFTTSDGGASWNYSYTRNGTGYINSLINLSDTIIASIPTANYGIVITDNFDSNNSDTIIGLQVMDGTVANVTIQKHWDYSYNYQSNHIDGIAADGVARFYFTVSKSDTSIGPAITSVDAFLSDGINSNTGKLGKLMAASCLTSYCIEANVANSLTATQASNVQNNFWFWYVAPDDFVGSNPVDSLSAYRFINVTFYINYSNGTSDTIITELKIVRPPVLLAHGLGGDASTWDNFSHSSSINYTVKFINDSRFKVIEPVKLFPNASFSLNAFQLTLGDSLIAPNGFYNSFQDVIRLMRNQGYVCNRLDYIGHSMGGVLFRYAKDQYSDYYYRTGNAANRDFKNYEMGYINKSITISSPHNSSPWADILNRYDDDLTLGMRYLLTLYYGYYPNSMAFNLLKFDCISCLVPTFEITDAVSNLQMNENNGGVNFGVTDGKNHLIAGDIIPGIQNTPGNIIPNEIIELVSQTEYDVDFLKHFINVAIAKETDQQLVNDLIELSESYSNPVSKYLGFIERTADVINTASFLPESDIIVSVNSQLADNANTALNVSVFNNVGHTFFKPIVENVSVGNRVLELLNTSINSSKFDVINATSNRNALQSSIPLSSPKSIVMAHDTNRVKIESPGNDIFLNVNEIIHPSVNVKDTTELLYVNLSFQGKTYQIGKQLGMNNQEINVSPSTMDNQLIYLESVYNDDDTLYIITDSVRVVINTSETLMDFSVTPEISYLYKDEVKFPKYLASYETFNCFNSSFSDSLTATVNDTSIVKYIPAYKGFRGKASGETFAVLNYKGLVDTIYFVVKEQTIDTITSIDDEYISNTYTGNGIFLNVFPNPAKTLLAVEYQIKDASKATLSLYDLVGNIVFSKQIYKNSTENSEVEYFDISSISTGIYIIEIKSTANSAHKKVAVFR